jgi:hypothetical protein
MTRAPIRHPAHECARDGGPVGRSVLLSLRDHVRVGENLSRKGDPVAKSAFQNPAYVWELRAWYRASGIAAPLKIEPRYTTGEVKLTLPSLVLLQALLDHPKATAPSIEAWARSARALSVGHLRCGTESTVRKAMHAVHPCWVVRKRVGRSITVRLTKRGMAIVRREVPARVIGRGAYESLRAFRQTSAG